MLNTSKYTPLEYGVCRLLEETQYNKREVRKSMSREGYTIQEIDKAIKFVLLDSLGTAMRYMSGRCGVKPRKKSI